MKAKLPGVDSTIAYSIYLCAGLLTWGLFAEIVGRAQNIFLEHANLMKKLSFPRMTLPVIVVLSAGLNFAIIFGLFLLFLLVTGNFPNWLILGTIPVLAVQVAFSVGLGITLGVLNVFFRDVGQFFGIFTQFWFWLTPIVYPASILPEEARHPAWLEPHGANDRGLPGHLRWWPMAGLAESPMPVVVAALLRAFPAPVPQGAGEMVDEL